MPIDPIDAQNLYDHLIEAERHGAQVEFFKSLRAQMSHGASLEIAIQNPNPLYPRASGGAGAEGLKKGILISSVSNNDAGS